MPRVVSDGGESIDTDVASRTSSHRRVDSVQHGHGYKVGVPPKKSLFAEFSDVLRRRPTAAVQGPAQIQEDMAQLAACLPRAILGQELLPRQVQGRPHRRAHHCQPLHTTGQ